jgi:hypothetical protein
MSKLKTEKEDTSLQKHIASTHILILNTEIVDDGYLSPLMVSRLKGDLYSLSEVEYGNTGKMKRVTAPQSVSHYKKNVILVALLLALLFFILFLVFLSLGVQYLGFQGTPDGYFNIYLYSVPLLSAFYAFIAPLVFYYAARILGIAFPGMDADFYANWNVLFLLILGIFVIPVCVFWVFLVLLSFLLSFVRQKWFLILAFVGFNCGNIVWICVGVVIYYSHLFLYDILSILFAGTCSETGVLYSEYLFSFIIGHWIQFIIHSLILLFTGYKIAIIIYEIIEGSTELRGICQLILCIISNILSFACLLLIFSNLHALVFIMHNINIALLVTILLLEIIAQIFSKLKKIKKKIVKPNPMIVKDKSASQEIMDSELNLLRKKLKRDQSIQLLVDNRDLKGFCKVISRQHGMPFVGKSRGMKKIILNNMENEEFGMFILMGDRGVGKSRIIHEVITDNLPNITILKGQSYPSTASFQNSSVRA